MQCYDEPCFTSQVFSGEDEVMRLWLYACLKLPLYRKGGECVSVKESLSVGHYVGTIRACRVIVASDLSGNSSIETTERVRESFRVIR